MQNNTILAPFTPDEGLPYIFISYAHVDRESVFPIIKRIYERGWRIWYDEGLELGNDYYSSLEKHIQNCAVFLLFASPNAANSHFITTSEIPQANAFRKKKVVVYLDPDAKPNIPGLHDAVCTDNEHLESVLEEIRFLTKTEPRQAVGHRIQANILSQARDSEYSYEKCAGGVRLINYQGKDPVVYLPEAYPPLSGLKVAELDSAVFWRHPELTAVHLPKGLKTIDISMFLNNKELKDLYVPTGVKVTDKFRVMPTEIPYAFHCTKGSFAHKFAEKNALVCILEDDSNPEFREKIKPYAYLSFPYGVENKSFSTVMMLEEHRCSYVLGRMGMRSRKKVLESIQNCTCFVAFIDRNYLESDEISDLRTALALEKKLAIYQLEECDLPEDLQNLQSIHQLRYNTGNEEERAIKLINWLTKNNCRDPYDYLGFEYKTTEEGIHLTRYIGRMAYPRIEPFFCGVPVVSVGGFAHCEFVRSVSLPDGIREIGYWAFSDCSDFRSVSIPSSVSVINRGAFRNCSRLEAIELPQSITRIGSGVFEGCVKLKSITLPSHIRVADGVYQGWPNLAHIEIPENERMIWDSAFRGCSGLKSVILHEQIQRIGAGAFSDCVNLKEITIPESVTEIGSEAFANCKMLRTVKLPEKLRRLHSNAFKGCSDLKEVIIPGIDTNILMNFHKDCEDLTIYCSEGSRTQRYCEKLKLRYLLLDK